MDLVCAYVWRRAVTVSCNGSPGIDAAMNDSVETLLLRRWPAVTIV